MYDASCDAWLLQERLARTLKARLHLQILLRFLVRFSPFDGCERVNQTRMFR